MPALSEAGTFAFDQIALTGQQAPGADDGVVYTEFGYATINRVGDIAFRAAVGAPNGEDTRTAAFGPASGNGSGLTMLAREGDPVPGVEDGLVFGRFDRELPYGEIALDSFGQMAFHSRLRDASATEDPTVRPNAIFHSGLDTGLMPIMRAGDPVPGLDGVVFETISVDPVLNDSGQLQYVARFSGPGVSEANDQAVFWQPVDGDARIVIRENDPLPDGSGLRFGGEPDDAYFTYDIRFNVAGDTALSTQLRDQDHSGIDIDGGSIIFGPTAGPGSELGVLFRSGTPVPGVPGAAFGELYLQNLYANGEILVVNQMEALPGASVNEATDEAIFRVIAGSPSSIEVLVREGDKAPGIEGDVVFGGELHAFRDQAFGQASSNAAGDLVFRSALSSPNFQDVTYDNDSALFRTTNGIGSPLELVFREGDPAPGQSDGAVFGTANKGWLLSYENGYVSIPAMNGAGDFVFFSELRAPEGEPPVDYSNGVGLFASVAGEVIPILREGESMEVQLANGLIESRTIADLYSSIKFNAGSQGDMGLMSFNDSGQLLMRLEFTDGSSGLFIFQVPEPAAGVVLGIALCWAATRRRRNG